MYDKTLFLSKRIAEKNDEIMNLYFQLNKKLDNFVNYIEVDLNMNKMSKELHTKYAHLAPIIADDFSDYNASFSYRSKYSMINGETKEYTDFFDGIDDILNLLTEIDIAFTDAKSIAKEEENDDYKKFISDEVVKLRTFKQQFILISDKATYAVEAGNTLQDIDHNYKDYII